MPVSKAKDFLNKAEYDKFINGALLGLDGKKYTADQISNLNNNVYVNQLGKVLSGS